MSNILKKKSRKVTKKALTPKEGVQAGVLVPGDKMFCFATGAVNPALKASREAVGLIVTQAGFVGVCPKDEHTIWFWRTLNDAKAARNVIRAHNGTVANHIMNVTVDDDGVPVIGGVAD